MHTDESEELRSSFLSLSGEQARVQTVTSLWLVLKQASGWKSTYPPPGREWLGGPQRMWHTLSWVSRLSRIFSKVSEVVREWRGSFRRGL